MLWGCEMIGKVQWTPRAKLEKYLDELCSEYVRRRAIARVGGCERCLRPKFDIQKEDGSILPAWKQLQCAHLISRWHKSTRWDEDVALGLCGGCHQWIDHEEEEKLRLLIKTLGEERAMLLKARSRQTGKPDLQGLILYYQEKIKEIRHDRY